MLVRILQFVIGALLAGGGGYLAWTHRTAGMNVFPPEAGMPWLVIAGVFGLCAGVVFLVSAVHPRPNTRARAAAKAKRRDETLGAAEAYYASKDSRRERAADSDWRSGDIAPPAAPAPPPAPEPVKMVEPVRVATPVVAAPAPAPEKPKVVEPKVVATEKPVVAQVVTAPAAVEVAPVVVAPVAPVPVAKPVATSAPPEPVLPPLFPSTATLAPIPAASEPPPAPVVEKAAGVVTEAKADAPVVAAGPFGAIKTALAAGKPDEAEKLLNAARDTAKGLELAELTGLAGDHAAAMGRISNAKWLWRLSLKRFGELGAMDTPAAQAVSESLRTAG